MPPLLVLLLLPFVGSIVAALLPTRARNLASLWAGGVALVALGWLLWLYPRVQRGAVLRETWQWLPGLDLDIVIRVDGFAWVFALLVVGIGALVVLYARYYMSREDPVARFFAFLLAFMGAMLGVVLSGNLVQLVFFWELTSLFSFLLIGYWYHRRDARRGARMALTVTATGGLALFAGVLVIGHIVGSYELDAVLGAGDQLRAHPLYLPALLLVLAGALTKSAQFPFHFWLPHAMAAPTPVSAYLHSATMVKAGVFLLARLWPALSGTQAWFWIVGGAGAATLLLGAYLAMFQRDLKGLLAYSTISHLGLITLLLGLNSPLAAVAAVFHIMNHATFKASLFMAAGIVDHETGTRDTRRLSGLFKALPITGTLALVASAAMAGVPLLNGFLSKEMFFAETVYIASLPWVEYGLPAIATLAGMFAVVYALRFSTDVFFGPPPIDLPREPHEPTPWMRVPIELLVLGCLVVGIVPEWAIGPTLAMAAAPVVGGELPHYSLSIWHGLNKPLAMSLVAMAGGVLLHRWLRRASAAGRLQQVPLIGRLDGKRAFEALLAFASDASRRALHGLATPRLQPQLFLVVLLALGAGLLAARGHPLGRGERAPLEATWAFTLLWTIGAVAALAAATQAKFHRLAALALLAVTGLVVCMNFAWFSAPDLALTQLAVEVVTTVLLLLGLRWLPQRIEDDPRSQRLPARLRRARDLLLAAGVGLGMAGVSYALLTRPAPQSISPYYLTLALPEGGGRNVVNVMLVDFRGFDTLGEITVLAAVALTIYALLRRFRPLPQSIEAPAQQRALQADVVTDLISPRTATDTALGYMMVPAVLVRLLLPVAGVVAAYLFLRGHNEPGGGFVAGLLVAIAFITQYMVAGAAWVESHVNVHPLRWIGIGILVAVATGVGAMLLGFPFLTSHTAHWTLPLFGEVHLASALFFDIGVFAVVVGSTLLILLAIAHQSLRAQRRPRAEPAMAAADAVALPAAAGGRG